MKIVPILSTILLLAAAQVNAQNHWIPAEKFEDHTNSTLEGSLVNDPNFDNRPTLILENNNAQVRIIIGIDQELEEFVNINPEFEVCAFVANAEDGQSNTVRAKHNDPRKSQDHVLEDERYRMVCSEIAPINYDNLLSSGLKVISPSEGSVKVRGISIRPIRIVENDTPSLADHELSRSLGYLWGDGGTTNNGEEVFFRRSSSRISRHFESVTSAAFGDALERNSQGSRYTLQLDGQSPNDFFANGPAVNPDPRAFLASVIEGEGAVLVGRLLDDPNPSRCAFLKELVDNLNPQCAVNTCTDSSCEVPNCAFIANGNRRGEPARDGGFCGVYLSGNASNWAELLDTDAFHFVNCNRVPGGECTQHPVGSRPALEQ